MISLIDYVIDRKFSYNFDFDQLVLSKNGKNHWFCVGI